VLSHESAGIAWTLRLSAEVAAAVFMPTAMLLRALE